VCVTLAVIGEVKNVCLGRRRVRGRCHSFAGGSLRHIRALDPKGDTMPEGPLDFWESLTFNEMTTWAFVLFGCFVVFVHLLKRAEEARNRRQLRKWQG
jgi:hypothetical protein